MRRSWHRNKSNETNALSNPKKAQNAVGAIFVFVKPSLLLLKQNLQCWMFVDQINFPPPEKNSSLKINKTIALINECKVVNRATV